MFSRQFFKYGTFKGAFKDGTLAVIGSGIVLSCALGSKQDSNTRVTWEKLDELKAIVDEIKASLDELKANLRELTSEEAELNKIIEQKQKKSWGTWVNGTDDGNEEI